MTVDGYCFWLGTFFFWMNVMNDFDLSPLRRQNKQHHYTVYINAQDPSEIGVTGLLWLFLSYGYALYYASDLIGQGSELLLLVPSMAGLVGGVVLPLLGAVPDGGTFSIYLFLSVACFA